MMTALDLDWIRAQFPALSQEVGGRPAVFLDGPGGTQVPRRVVDAVSHCLVHANANIHGKFITSARAEEIIAQARGAMADLLGALPEEIAFGPNMTTLTFALSRAIGRELSPGDEVVVTRLDHDANVAPWRALAEKGVVVREVDIHVEDCTLDMDGMARAINARTRLVAVGYASNAVGTVNDVAAVVRLARAVGALVFVDAVAYAPHAPIDVRALDCDFLACSPYKFFGPHMGVLYGKREHLERLRPYKVRPSPDDLVDRWETGTQNHEGLAGVTAAVDYLADLGQRIAGEAPRRAALLAAMSAIREHERALAEELVSGLLGTPGVTVYGITDPARFASRVPTVSVRVAGQTLVEISRALGEQGIFTWNGNFYALSLTERLGVEESGGLLRLGLVHYNTREEVSRTLSALRAVVA